MDEMAEKLGMDPIEFRIVNDTQVVPDILRPSRRRPIRSRRRTRRSRSTIRIRRSRSGNWSSACGRARSASAGTSATRSPAGCATGAGSSAWAWPRRFATTCVMKSAARVRLDRRGIVTVETDMTDIGTGSYTVIAQTAAEMMGVPLDKVVVRLGDSSFPVSCGSGGQWGGNSSTSGVYAACVKLREAVAQKAGFNASDAVFADGQVRVGLAQRAARRGGRRSRSRRGRRDRVRRPRQALQASDLRRALRRGRRRRRHRRDARAAHARGLRGRPHPQPQDRAQPGDRRHDDGRRRGADGGARGRQALRLLREPRPRELRGAGACRHPAPGGDLPRRDRSRSPRR